MDWWHSKISSPYGFLAMGAIFLITAVVSTCTGKIYGPYGTRASRPKKPIEFWLSVAICYIAAVYFIGCFLYKVCVLSH